MGDNLYCKDSNGSWKRHPTLFHYSNENFVQDIKHPYIFISKHFFYFGENAVDVEDIHRGLIVKRQGIKCDHKEELVEDFVSWLEATYKVGIHGKPTDNPDRNKRLTRRYSELVP